MKRAQIRRKIFLGLLFSLLAFFIYFLPLDIENSAKITLAILIFAALFWVFEIFPLWLTSLIVLIELIISGVFSTEEAIINFCDPILALFFAGFMLAEVIKKRGLDKHFARLIISHSHHLRRTLLLIMAITAFLSMWISNTAAAVIMIPLALALIKKRDIPNFSKIAVLGIAFAANIGGMGTIVGTPPNGIVVSKLAEFQGIETSFLQWMSYAFPLVIIFVPITWLILLYVFPIKDKLIKIKEDKEDFNKGDYIFFLIFIATVLAWLSSSFHGLSAPIAGLISVAILAIFRLIKVKDLHKVSWETLILFGGGLVLGSAMFDTGLSGYFAEIISMNLANYSEVFVSIVLVVFAVLLSSFASNTAVAAILIPTVIPIVLELGFSPKTFSILIGLAVSLVFMIPVGTPPNAIAYGSGKIRMFDMFKAGAFVSLTLIPIYFLYTYLFW